jgi:hypothetical protein
MAGQSVCSRLLRPATVQVDFNLILCDPRPAIRQLVSLDLSVADQRVHELGSALDLRGSFFDGQHKNPPLSQYCEKRNKPGYVVEISKKDLIGILVQELN